MSLFNLSLLDDNQTKTVKEAVRAWCARYNVPAGSEREGAAMIAAVKRALSGEKSHAALLEAISIEMRIQQYKLPSD